MGHYEGRGWIGLHRHLVLAQIAFAFLQHLRLEQAGLQHLRLAQAGGWGKKWPIPTRATTATHAAGSPAHAG